MGEGDHPLPPQTESTGGPRTPCSKLFLGLLSLEACTDKKVFVEGLSIHTVINYDRIEKLLEMGNAQRQTSETKMNEKSSRSHSIMQFHLNQTHAKGAGCQVNDAPSHSATVILGQLVRRLLNLGFNCCFISSIWDSISFNIFIQLLRVTMFVNPKGILRDI